MGEQLTSLLALTSSCVAHVIQEPRCVYVRLVFMSLPETMSHLTTNDFIDKRALAMSLVSPSTTNALVAILFDGGLVHLISATDNTINITPLKLTEYIHGLRGDNIKWMVRNRPAAMLHKLTNNYTRIALTEGPTNGLTLWLSLGNRLDIFSVTPDGEVLGRQSTELRGNVSCLESVGESCGNGVVVGCDNGCIYTVYENTELEVNLLCDVTKECVLALTLIAGYKNPIRGILALLADSTVQVFSIDDSAACVLSTVDVELSNFKPNEICLALIGKNILIGPKRSSYSDAGAIYYTHVDMGAILELPGENENGYYTRGQEQMTIVTEKVSSSVIDFNSDLAAPACISNQKDSHEKENDLSIDDKILIGADTNLMAYTKTNSRNAWKRLTYTHTMCRTNDIVCYVSLSESFALIKGLTLDLDLVVQTQMKHEFSAYEPGLLGETREKFVASNYYTSLLSSNVLEYYPVIPYNVTKPSDGETVAAGSFIFSCIRISSDSYLPCMVTPIPYLFPLVEGDITKSIIIPFEQTRHVLAQNGKKKGQGSKSYKELHFIDVATAHPGGMIITSTDLELSARLDDSDALPISGFSSPPYIVILYEHYLIVYNMAYQNAHVVVIVKTEATQMIYHNPMKHTDNFFLYNKDPAMLIDVCLSSLFDIELDLSSAGRRIKQQNIINADRLKYMKKLESKKSINRHLEGYVITDGVIDNDMKKLWLLVKDGLTSKETMLTEWNIPTHEIYSSKRFETELKMDGDNPIRIKYQEPTLKTKVKSLFDIKEIRYINEMLILLTVDGNVKLGKLEKRVNQDDPSSKARTFLNINDVKSTHLIFNLIGKQFPVALTLNSLVYIHPSELYDTRGIIKDINLAYHSTIPQIDINVLITRFKSNTKYNGVLKTTAKASNESSCVISNECKTQTDILDSVSSSPNFVKVIDKDQHKILNIMNNSGNSFPVILKDKSSANIDYCLRQHKFDPSEPSRVLERKKPGLNPKTHIKCFGITEEIDPHFLERYVIETQIPQVDTLSDFLQKLYKATLAYNINRKNELSANSKACEMSKLFDEFKTSKDEYKKIKGKDNWMIYLAKELNLFDVDESVSERDLEDDDYMSRYGSMGLEEIRGILERIKNVAPPKHKIRQQVDELLLLASNLDESYEQEAYLEVNNERLRQELNTICEDVMADAPVIREILHVLQGRKDRESEDAGKAPLLDRVKMMSRDIEEIRRICGDALDEIRRISEISRKGQVPAPRYDIRLLERAYRLTPATEHAIYEATAEEASTMGKLHEGIALELIKYEEILEKYCTRLIPASQNDVSEIHTSTFKTMSVNMFLNTP